MILNNRRRYRNKSLLFKKAFVPVVFFSFFFISHSICAQENILEQNISLKSQSNSVYRILNQISRQTEHFFIYDSQIIDGDKIVRIKSGEKKLIDLLGEILDNPELRYKIIENYIIVYIPEEELSEEQEDIDEADEEEIIIINGKIMDEESGEPLAYASINISEKGKGIVSNLDGVFRLKVEEEHLQDTLQISHLGYENRRIPIPLIVEGTHDIYLKRDYLSLPEIIISYYNPEVIINEAIAVRHKMYPLQATNHTSFYREGILQGREILNYSEAIFNIYKTAYNSPVKDAVSIVKSRSITNANFEDSLLLKLKAGVGSVLELDLIKNMPDFLDPEYKNQYSLIFANLITYNDRDTYAIGFEPVEDFKESLFRGTVFVDKDNFAIVRIEFEIDPRRLKAAQRILIPRQNPNFSSKIQSAEYSVSYKLYNEKYHLNHVRGDLTVRVRRKNKLFGNNYKIFFEKAVLSIETENVSKIKRRERLKKREVFSETSFEYDFEFWKDYNFLSPEEEIQNALPKINSIIESVNP
ncbi:MAG: STN and carboxypeptidase regulatory-like domain-containing protein [Bacteroidota bacterium]